MLSRGGRILILTLRISPLLLCTGTAWANAEKNGNYSLRLGRDSSVSLPVGFHPARARFLRFAGPGFSLNVFSGSFSQGEAGYLELVPTGSPQVVPISCTVAGRRVPLEKRTFGHAGLFGLATGDRPGLQPIVLAVRRGGKVVRRSFHFWLHATDFRTFESSMDLGRFSRSGYLKKRPDLQAFIAGNRKKKGRAFAGQSSLVLGGTLFHPRDRHFITSPFHARRVARRYSIGGGRVREHRPSVNVHSGTDLKGRHGEPIFAVARGRVALAEKMYYEGNFTVLDHGQGIFTTYMHQSRLDVREGAVVEAGRQIGLVGATGMVTGPHLHISLYIRGVQLDALSLIVLPIRP